MAAQFHFWEYIKGNPTFILDSHRPFICSADYYYMHRLNMELDLQTFIWAPCAQLYSLADTLQTPPPPHLGSYTWAPRWRTSLCNSLHKWEPAFNKWILTGHSVCSADYYLAI
jgi:hypothetical protein